MNYDYKKMSNLTRKQKKVIEEVQDWRRVKVTCTRCDCRIFKYDLIDNPEICSFMWLPQEGICPSCFDSLCWDREIVQCWNCDEYVFAEDSCWDGSHFYCSSDCYDKWNSNEEYDDEYDDEDEEGEEEDEIDYWEKDPDFEVMDEDDLDPDP